MGAYVDISSHNGTPNLKAYRDAGHTDLMLKATEGTGYVWAGMASLAREWHSFGPQYRVGYYHWLYGTLSGSAQFAWFWSHVSPVWRPASDWLMVDFEDIDASRRVSDGQYLTVLSQFGGLAAQHGPVHYYAPDWYLAALPECRAWLKGRPVVASDYSHTPPLNHYGLTFVAHQYTDRATVPGFAGPVDYNRWLATESGASAGATKIGDDMPLTDAEWKRLDDLLQLRINNALTSQRNWINYYYGPEVLGSTQREHDNTLALAGQLNTLHAAELDAIKAIQPATGTVDATAVQAAAEAGAAKAIAGATVETTSTSTIHPGGTNP